MNKHHFFAASALDWATTTPDRDLQALLKLMDKQRNTYTLYLVPIPHDTPYEINFYQPQVEGTMHLETFTFKRGEKK
jgi:hypothetical protein